MNGTGSIYYVGRNGTGRIYYVGRNARGRIYYVKVKSKVFYGQEPPSGESTTTECGFNYQLLAVIY